MKSTALGRSVATLGTVLVLGLGLTTTPARAASVPGAQTPGASPASGTAGFAVAGAAAPNAVVGEAYSYRFRLTDGGTAFWSPLVALPLGLALDPETGALSGVPEQAGTQQILVSASRGGSGATAGAIASASAVLTVEPSAAGATSVWELGSDAPLSQPAPAVAAAGPGAGAVAPATAAAATAAAATVTVPEAVVASALYQAMYFQAVDNPQAPQHDLVTVLLADVAAQEYATTPAAGAATVTSNLAALKSAFVNATNPLAPRTAGKGLQSFGPTLVPQLTGALGVMVSFAKTSGAGVIGPAVRTVASQVYSSYLKTSIATGIGYSAGYAGFSDRSLYDVGDDIAGGFHALVSGPAIQRAVACGQANAACASVENSLLTPVVHAGLGTTAAVSVAYTPAQLQISDPTLKTMLSATQLNISIASNGTVSMTSAAYDALLTRAGGMNLSLGKRAAADVKDLIAQEGDPTAPAGSTASVSVRPAGSSASVSVHPADISDQASADLAALLPSFNFTLTGTLFTTGIGNAVSPSTAPAKDKPLLDGSTLALGVTDFLKFLGITDSTWITGISDSFAIGLDALTGQWGDAIKNLFGILGALVGSPAQDEALLLAQQTDQLIEQVYDALTQDLTEIEGSIQGVQATLDDMFQQMELGFADIDFDDHKILAGLGTVEYTLGQLQYQVDLTDGDVVAFGQGEIQQQIQGTINRCLDLAARNLSPLTFAKYSSCAGDFKTEALTDSSNDVVEFTTAAPPAPTAPDFSADGAVATVLGQHGLDPDANLRYLLAILYHWYGLGTDPAAVSPAVVNAGVWSEVALAYRELLDEYPQYSAGAEPDLAAIEAPGEQVATMIGGLQQDDTSSWTNPAITKLGANYAGALSQLTSDIAAHQAVFPTVNNQAIGYGTPSGDSWHGYDPFGGVEQARPGAATVPQDVSTISTCPGGSPLSVPTTAWPAGLSLPNSFDLVYNLVGYSNGALAAVTPLCYSFSRSEVAGSCSGTEPHVTCSWKETLALSVQFEGTDGTVHTLKALTPSTKTIACTNVNGTYCSSAQDFLTSLITSAGSLTALLANSGGTTASDATELEREATPILAAEQRQAYAWDADGFTTDIPDHAQLIADTTNLSGAFELLQLTAQILAPSASLANQAIADILYGSDQLATTPSGPNGPVPVLVALARGTGTTTLSQWSALQQQRLGEAQRLINGFLGSAQQAAGASAATAAPGADPAVPAVTAPPRGDLATTQAPALTFGVLSQLATGALLDTDAVTVKSPGNRSGVVGKAASVQLSASSSAGAKITAWKAVGLPAGLAIAATTGRVTGTPTATGTFTVTVTATDTVGASVHKSGSVTFTWKIAPGTFATAPVPTITGTAKVGSVLTAHVGTFKPTPTSRRYQWKRNGSAISGAKSASYKLVAADAGKKITVTVTAGRSGYQDAATTSKATAAVARGTFSTAPIPTITGTAKVGKTLTAHPRTWSPAATGYSYLWKRSGVQISGATSASHKLVAADRGKKITVTVTAHRAGYTDTARTSAATAAVAG